MKHVMFPTVAAADAFIADLQSRGVVHPEVGTMNMSRRVQNAATDTTVQTGTVTTPATTTAQTTEYVEGGGTAEDAGAGAVKGTVAGALTGAAAGVLGTAAALGTTAAATAATVATGGLALPVILGMAALGSGVGAAVGAVGGAAGVDETGGEVRTTTTTSNYPSTYEVDDAYYNRVNDRVSTGGRVVAVDDNVPQDVLMDAVAKHGGEIITA